MPTKRTGIEPMHNRRNFLRAGATAGASLLLSCRHVGRTDLDPMLTERAGDDPAATSVDEEFWRAVRGAFELKPGLVNLNHGVSPSPRDLHTALHAEMDEVNGAPTLFMRNWPAEGRREEARSVAAEALGCHPEELAITRCATEGLVTAQLGIDLEPGDEVLSTSEDYWAMWNTWQQRVSRDGIVYRQLDFGAPYPADGEIVDRFERALTPRTRVILLSQMTWVTGHVLPIRDVCAMARRHGVLTIVDGAHGFGHFPFRVDELGCDLYATSGHKWLHAPLGTGLFYVRREIIPDVWPLTPADHERWQGDIRKFEFLGSRSPAHHNSIKDAVEFLNQIGVERKAARLHYLKRRWVESLRAYDRVQLVTDPAPGRSFGIASFHVEGVETASLAERLLKKHRILVAVPEDGYSGPPVIRVAPNVFTSADEIDLFTEAVEEVLKA